MPGWTLISAAIDFSARLIASSGLTAERKVIDVSGDGSNNDGRDVTAARDDAVAAGITVNGLPIVEVEPGLDDYYRRNVIGGPGAFVVVARDIDVFRRGGAAQAAGRGRRPVHLSRGSGRGRRVAPG